MATRREGLPLPKNQNLKTNPTSNTSNITTTTTDQQLQYLPKSKNKPNKNNSTRFKYQQTSIFESIWDQENTISENIKEQTLQERINYRLARRVSCPLPDGIDLSDKQKLVKNVIFECHKQIKNKYNIKTDKMEFHSKFQKVYIYCYKLEDAQFLHNKTIELYHQEQSITAEKPKENEVVYISANISHIIPYEYVERELSEYGKVDTKQCIYGSGEDGIEVYSDLFKFRVTLDDGVHPENLPGTVQVGEKFIALRFKGKWMKCNKCHHWHRNDKKCEIELLDVEILDKNDDETPVSGIAKNAVSERNETAVRDSEHETAVNNFEHETPVNNFEHETAVNTEDQTPVEKPFEQEELQTVLESVDFHCSDKPWHEQPTLNSALWECPKKCGTNLTETCQCCVEKKTFWRKQRDEALKQQIIEPPLKQQILETPPSIQPTSTDTAIPMEEDPAQETEQAGAGSTDESDCGILDRKENIIKHRKNSSNTRITKQRRSKSSETAATMKKNDEKHRANVKRQQQQQQQHSDNQLAEDLQMSETEDEYTSPITEYDENTPKSEIEEQITEIRKLETINDGSSNLTYNDEEL